MAKPLEIIPGPPREPWRDFFARMNPRPDGTCPVLSVNDLESAVYFWRCFPRFYAEIQRDRNMNALPVLVLRRLQAEALMIKEAERCGLDSQSICASGDLCLRITQAHPELGEEQFTLWPSCLEVRTTGLAERFRAAIQAAEDVLSRLVTRRKAGGA